MHTYLHLYIHTYRQTYIHLYIHTYIYTYIPTSIHTYIHTDGLSKTAIRTNKWPINKRSLIRRHYKEFTNFINEIQFDKLNVE